MPKRTAFMVVGGGFGDEGKGTTVDYLTRRYGAHTVLRYNGGSQAAHNVVTPEGIHHCFAQFGSGTLVPGTLTYLSQFMFVDPFRLVSEYEVLASKGVKDVLERLVISKRCPIITPFHKFAGQLRELARGAGRFGSCGMGVGEAMNDFAESPAESLRIGDLVRIDILERKLRQLQNNKIAVAKKILESRRDEDIQKCFEEIRSRSLLERCLESYLAFSDFPINFDNGQTLKRILDRPGAIIFEGAQGVLLDRKRGFRPFVTKSDCTFGNAEKLLIDFNGRIIRLAVVRAYMTRHGNGPFVTEDSELTALIPDVHNTEGKWQGNFRIGWFDLVATRYALDVIGKVDYMILTNLDRIINFSSIRVCSSYTTAESRVPLNPFFEFSESINGPQISGIKKISRALNSRQLELTRLLSGCKPVYQKLVSPDQKTYIDFLERKLDVKIEIISPR